MYAETDSISRWTGPPGRRPSGDRQRARSRYPSPPTPRLTARSVAGAHTFSDDEVLHREGPAGPAAERGRFRGRFAEGSAEAWATSEKAQEQVHPVDGAAGQAAHHGAVDPDVLQIVTGVLLDEAHGTGRSQGQHALLDEAGD